MAINGNTGGNNMHQTNTEYTSLIATGSDPNTTTTNGNATADCSGAVGPITVTINGDPGSGNSYTFTVMVNGVATSNQCAISGSGVTSCTSTVSASVTAGQTVNVRITPASNPTARAVSMFFGIYAGGGTALS
jgi:hypothetical protein